MNKRFLSLCLTVALLLGIFAAAPIGVSAASQMTASESCLSVIKELEGFSATPYRDVDGNYTIGYGTKCPSDKVSYYTRNPMSRSEADAELRKEMGKFEKDVNAFIDRHSLNYNQGQFDGVLSLVFNCGTSFLTSGETLINALTNDVSDNELIYAFAIYSMSGGNRSVGHISRRLAEANMYLNADYGRYPPDRYSYVLFNPNGGKLSTYNVQGFDARLTATIVPTATYSGYTFDGWYTKANGGDKVMRLDNSTKGITLYAHWSKGGTSINGGSSTPSTNIGNAIDPLKVKVTVDKLNVRKGPGLSYSVVDAAYRNEELTLTAIYKEGSYVWGKCSLGWLRLDNTNYEEVIKTPEVKPEPDKEQTIGTAITPIKVKVTVSSVRVRKGPGLNYEQVGSAARNKELTITALYNEGKYVWGKCSTGWVRLDNTDYKAAEDTPDDEPEEENVIYGTVTGTDSLNVRLTPNGTLIGTLKRGNRVIILEQKKVNTLVWGRYSGGWICLTGYVTLETVSGSQQPTEPSQPDHNAGETKLYGTVINTATLNIRSTPDGKIVGKLRLGDRVEILERKTVSGREWGKCAQGWICIRTYVKLETVTTGGTTSNPQAPTQPEENAAKTYATVVNADVLNVRKTPEGVICGNLKMGDKVEITEQKTVGSRVWGKCSKGWICLTGYTKVETDNGNTDNDNGSKIGKVTASSLNVRAGAGTNYAVVAGLFHGQTVEILETKTVNGTQWGRIAQGWVCMDYIAL